MRDPVQDWLQRADVSVETVLVTIVIVLAAWFIVALVNRVLRRGVWQAGRYLNLSYETSLMGARVVTASVWVIAVLVLLNLWGANVTGLWTLLISAAAVIGVGFLAVWTMVSNVTVSVFITIWRPFHLGDTIELLPENLKGRVIDRNMMFTAVRDETGCVLQIPNNLFFQKIFKVGGGGSRSLFELLENRNLQQRKGDHGGPLQYQPQIGLARTSD
jgi:small-conductance mechanosensitive channel